MKQLEKKREMAGLGNFLLEAVKYKATSDGLRQPYVTNTHGPDHQPSRRVPQPRMSAHLTYIEPQQWLETIPSYEGGAVAAVPCTRRGVYSRHCFLPVTAQETLTAHERQLPECRRCTPTTGPQPLSRTATLLLYRGLEKGISRSLFTLPLHGRTAPSPIIGSWDLQPSAIGWRSLMFLLLCFVCIR